MAQWNAKELAKKGKKDFEKVWNETKSLVKTSGGTAYKEAKPGRGQPILETLEKLRHAYLDMGFEELINPLFIEDKEVHKQFGPEAIAVLDRCYYIGGLPRPDIGLSEDRLNRIKEMGIIPRKKELQGLLRSYKLGDIAGDDLIAELAKALQIEDTKAVKMLDEVFPEVRRLMPKASNITLRSHMTSGWFLTLEALYGKRDHPMKLFSIDRCFRREQSEDPGHLRTYYSASAVIMDDNVGPDDGKQVIMGLLKRFGFTNFRFTPDEKRSKYYTPDTQTEVFGQTEAGDWVEIATFGIYSPLALSRYGIEHPVMNLGLGVERLALVLTGEKDIRTLAYPQFYSGLSLSDEEISAGVEIDKLPKTPEGKMIVKRIGDVALENAMVPSPCRFEVYKGELLGRKVKVRLVEVEEGTKLLGPAALNRVVVHEGSVLGVSPSKTPEAALKSGTDTGITYIEALGNLAAWEIEEAARMGETFSRTQVKGVKLPSDINLKLTDVVVRYITSNHKKIDIRGPVFTTVEAELD